VSFPSNYNETKGVYSHHITKLSLVHPEYKQFLYFFLTATQPETATFITGTTVRGLDVENLKRNKLVPIPKPSEQNLIPRLLMWFDKLLENKNAQNEILEGCVLAVFRNLVSGGSAPESYAMEAGTEPKFSASWKTKRLSQLADFRKGRKCQLVDERTYGCRPYLLIDAYETGEIVYWTTENQSVSESDIVLVADGERSGKVFRFEVGALGSTLLALRLKRGSEGLEHFLYVFLKSMEDELMEHRTGSAVPHLDKDFVAALSVPMPSREELIGFNSIVDLLFRKLIVNRKQVLLLRRVRQMLLPLLVFGKLRIE
jgi:type I restriction enzyme S subunit